MTYSDLAVAAGWPPELADTALWECSAFPFCGLRTLWYQLRHSWRLAQRAGFLPAAPDGGFRS
jgi:hypothetical protein